MYYLGIDVGGTKTAVGIFSAGGGKIISCSFATDPSRGCDDLVSRIAAASKRLFGEAGIEKCEISAAGAASPGPLDLKKGTIVHAPMLGFKNEPIKEMLSRALSLPVYLENDANCAALAEALAGAGAGKDPVVYITVSTGVGCGIIIGGEILSGFAFSAGELGHLIVKPGGKACPCGMRGCLETYSSGTALAEEAEKRFGRPLSAKDVFSLAREGDKTAEEIVSEAADPLAFGISAVCRVIDPEAVIIGGGVSRDWDVLYPALCASLEKYLPKSSIDSLTLARARLEGDAGMIGAALFAERSKK